MKYDFDLIVIGTGAGGNVGAHYATSIKKSVAIFEKDTIGGECPNWACVPTKALLHSAQVLKTIKSAKDFGINVKDIEIDYSKIKSWKNLVVSRTGAAEGEKIFKEDGIKFIHHKAEFISPHQIKAGDKIYSARKFLIATGSQTSIPPIPGIENSEYITFKQAIDLKNPPKSLFILGGGPIGCEFAQIFSTFGTKVIIADTLPKLIAKEDHEVSDLIQALFEQQGIKVLTNTSITQIEKKNNSKIIHYTNSQSNHIVEVEHILIATGKKPVLDFAPEKAKLKIENGFLKVNRYLQTSQPHIYAAGDIIGPYLFTHTGYYQSHLAIKNAFSYLKEKSDYSVVPRCIFTLPEVASVGLSEQAAKQLKIKYKKGLSPISILGKANTSNQFDGFIKVITNEKQQIIGGAIVCERAGEMIHEIALAIKLKAQASEVANMMHAYPTYSEGIKVACSNLE